MKFNHIHWRFVNKSGTITKLSWMSDFETIKYYIQAHEINWVQL